MKEPSRLAFFKALDPTEYRRMIREWVYLFLQGAGSDRISGNDKRVGVPVFTNRKIKTTKSKTRQSDPESLSEKATSYSVGKAYIRFSLRRCVRSQ